jgi:6-phosphogluconolactonase (cycloisomerase 2 family)
MKSSVLGLLVAVLGVAVSVPAVHAADARARQSEAVFAMTNNADQNQVLSFTRDGEGRFDEGPRYNTGGRGSGGVNDPLESQGSLTFSTDHSLLFAANAGSGDVTVFRVHNGRLSFADREDSGGSNPVAVAQYQNVLYVLNQGGAGSVVAFRLEGNGRLRQIENSTQFLSANATGGASISVSPDGRFVAVVERLANNIDIFPIRRDGTPGAAVVNASPGPGAFSGRFAPDGKLIVSETGPAGGQNASAVSSYTVQANGTLTAVSQSVPTLGAANCWNAITPDGRFVYVSNAGSSNISGFAIGPDGSLTPIGSTVVGSNPPGSVNLDIAVSGDGQYLFSLNATVGTIGVFPIRSDGTLDQPGELQGLPAAAGENGIAAF